MSMQGKLYISVQNNNIENIKDYMYYKIGKFWVIKYEDYINYLPNGIVRLECDYVDKIIILPHSVQYLILLYCNININFDKLPPNLTLIQINKYINIKNISIYLKYLYICHYSIKDLINSIYNHIKLNVIIIYDFQTYMVTKMNSMNNIAQITGLNIKIVDDTNRININYY